MTESIKIGERIAKAREAHKLSVTELAERAGLSADLVKGIEHDELPASLTPLIKIARALGVRLGTFLDDNENIGPVVSRVGAPASAVRFAGKSGSPSSDLDFFSLAPDKSGRHMEPFIIDIHASSAQNAKPSSHEGEEFIYVLQGSVEIVYGKDIFVLETGDSVYYDSIVAHHVHSKNGEAKILAVVYAPY